MGGRYTTVITLLGGPADGLQLPDEYERASILYVPKMSYKILITRSGETLMHFSSLVYIRGEDGRYRYSHTDDMLPEGCYLEEGTSP
jgi:hypothetical protein